jgi:hypothetical protein
LIGCGWRFNWICELPAVVAAAPGAPPAVCGRLARADDCVRPVGVCTWLVARLAACAACWFASPAKAADASGWIDGWSGGGAVTAAVVPDAAEAVAVAGADSFATLTP